MKRILPVLLFCASLFAFTHSKAQTFTVNHQIPWSTDYQNMWGPNGSPFSLNFDYSLFHFMYDSTTTFGQIENILGGDFGAEFDLDMYLEMGSTFSIHGFTTGWVDVDYPVDIELTFPDSGLPVPGQYMTVNSDYDVLPGWDLSSHFPQAGVVTLDLDFGMSMDLSGQVCFIGCTPVNIANFDIPLDSIIIFELNSITGEVTYPCINGFLPAICHDTILPLIITNIGGIGLDLTADIPYIQTIDSLGSDKCLYAYGDDWYLELSLDIIEFLSFIANIIPPPAGPAIASVLSMLNGTYDLGYGISIDYSLLSAFLTLNNTLQQDLTFCPDVWTELTYPIALDYFITDPIAGDTVGTGTNDSISFMAGHDLHVKWPCFGYTEFDPGIRHFLTNDFTNHTWDSMAFDFSIQAFEFTINFPSFPVAPASDLPELCVAIPQNDSAATRALCVDPVQTPEVYLDMSKLSFHIGPLVDYTIPLGYIPLTWYLNTWELDGFHDTIFPSVHLESGPFFQMTILGDTTICYGDSTGTLIATGINGASPYSFQWSTGENDSHSWPTDSIFVPSGLYSVTVTDGGGCTLSDDVIVVDNPQIFVSLSKTDVNCFGDSTGTILSTVSGGTPGVAPGYNWLWMPGNASSQNITNIPAGFYTLVVTDSLGCTASDTITVNELHPHPPVDVMADPSVGCQPLLVQFDEINPSTGNSYNWDFGDNSTFSIAEDPLHEYDTAGTFSVTLTVTNEWNCATTETYNDLIMVYPKPAASFYATPDLVYTSEDPSMTIDFTNTSSGEIAWLWNFADSTSANNTSTFENPSHSFSDEGLFDVMLIVTSDLGCMDTAWVSVEVIDDVLVFPNVITPNNDGFNDVFEIVNVEKFPECKLTVFNRWGNIVYMASPYRNDWDGENSADGTYFYVFIYGKDSKEYRGSLTIIR
ncbi:MAG: gliding motility-associated C-terminal domain-containing protein [Bacteroidales bacterium]|jgi:gliding motility-associated-like protein|nr:gliding motility-associated C-terminal domain-containing protein [Bacteroidales bacterium]HPB01523.1 gliding motility-associated C-terminal domain-containing protein [Bacteroidales bacterium]